MDHNQEKNPSELTNDEQLDLLLEKFLAEDMESEVPAILETDVPADAPVEEIPAEIPESIPLFEELETAAASAQEEMPITEMEELLPERTETPLDAELANLELEAILKEALQDIASTAEEARNELNLTEDTILLETLPDTTELSPAETEEPESEAEPEPEVAPEEYPEEEVDAQPQQQKKRRPKKTRAYGFFGIPHMVTTVIWLALIVFIGAGLGRMIWQVAADMLAFGRPNQAVTITITDADDLDSITDKLYDTGLIHYKSIFKFYGKLANAEQKINPGTYNLNTIYDYKALVDKMSTYAARASTKVTIPEGYTCAQIFQLLEKSGVCTKEKLENAAMTIDLSKYWFLEGVAQDNANCLEGYLFPDTYNFYLDDTPERVLGTLLSTFNRRFSDTMKEKLDALNLTLADMMRRHGLPESYIQEHQITIRELVIIASMVEKETAGAKESYNIASVIYNRLTNPGEYPFLNIDATVVYALGGKTNLTLEDLKVDSPYNTYVIKGLPAGPISNPGLASLSAALSPENTSFHFYALNPSTGYHEFFKTYAAHQAFLESLRNGGA